MTKAQWRGVDLSGHAPVAENKMHLLNVMAAQLLFSNRLVDARGIWTPKVEDAYQHYKSLREKK